MGSWLNPGSIRNDLQKPNRVGASTNRTQVRTCPIYNLVNTSFAEFQDNPD